MSLLTRNLPTRKLVRILISVLTCSSVCPSGRLVINHSLNVANSSAIGELENGKWNAQNGHNEMESEVVLLERVAWNRDGYPETEMWSEFWLMFSLRRPGMESTRWTMFFWRCSLDHILQTIITRRYRCSLSAHYQPSRPSSTSEHKQWLKKRERQRMKRVFEFPNAFANWSFSADADYNDYTHN